MRLVIEGQITWGYFNMDFLDRFFHLEQRERKMQEFVILRQGGMNMKKYSINFIQLSKHAPSMVEDSRAKINKFAMGISDPVVYQYRLSIFIPSMYVLVS